MADSMDNTLDVSSEGLKESLMVYQMEQKSALYWGFCLDYWMVFEKVKRLVSQMELYSDKHLVIKRGSR